LNIDNKRVLVGTKGSEIYEFSCQESKLSEKTNWSFKNLIKGHYAPNSRGSNQVWAMAAYKNNDLYVTASDDGTIRLWSSIQKKQIKCFSLEIDIKGNKLPRNKQS